jgi:hypothetical protein
MKTIMSRVLLMVFQTLQNLGKASLTEAETASNVRPSRPGGQRFSQRHGV